MTIAFSSRRAAGRTVNQSGLAGETIPPARPAPTQSDGTPAVVVLPPKLDFQAAGELAGMLAGHRGGALDLDAGAVTQVGALCLQLVLAASRQWQTDGLDFRVSSPSAAFMEGTDALGLDFGVQTGGQAR